jgi:3-oxoacyl-[acyl-carrier-protein] synthase-1
MSWSEPVHRSIAIVSIGACSPIGLSARMTQVEMEAGTVRFVETEVHDLACRPVRASRLKLLEPGAARTERMVSLGVSAVRDCLGGIEGFSGASVPLVLALPEAGSGAGYHQDVLLDALVRAASPIRLVGAESRLYPHGRAGFFRALVVASDVLWSREASAVLVGGIDSMGDSDSLAHLARRGRTLGQANRDGLIPGEAGGFLLLVRGASLRASGLVPRGWVLSVAMGREPHPFLSSEPSVAKGLTDVFRQLRQQPWFGGRRVNAVLSCQTGESFWGTEFVRAYLRNAVLMPEPLTVELVAERLGDIGAAAGALQLGYALHSLKKVEWGTDAPPRALVYGCSDAGEVGACVVERAG